MRRLLLAVIPILWALPAAAQQNAPAFDLPIDCKLGENCDLILFVDHDGSKGWQDHRCGYLSYDKHKGTDIRLRSGDQMLRGVDVVAAANGRVVRTRRGMPDISYKAVGRDVIDRRGLGNVVILDHGGGWQTIYAHLKRHSIRVAKDQQIKKGQVLGQVGMSGLTQNPHLHFAVLHRKAVMNPFTGTSATEKCSTGGGIAVGP